VAFAYYLFSSSRRLSLPTSRALIEFVHHRIDRPSVNAPLCTARQLIFALGHILPPKTARAPMVASYLAGLARRKGSNPLPQAAAEPQQLLSLLLALASVAAHAKAIEARLLLAVVLLMTAALRTPEAIITLQHGNLELSPHPEDDRLRLAMVTPDGLKDDKGRAIVNPRPRPMLLPSAWEERIRAVWATPLTEQQAKALDATVRRLIHASGISDVRQLRRLAARSAWSAMDKSPEEKALLIVRAVLGHREGSQSTFRYIPSRSNSHTRQLLTAAATAAPCMPMLAAAAASEARKPAAVVVTRRTAAVATKL